MSSFALRGYRSSRQTFFRGYAPQHAPGFRGKMGGLLKVALLGTCAYFFAKKISPLQRWLPACPAGFTVKCTLPAGYSASLPCAVNSDPSSGGPTSPVEGADALKR
ncbi:hypothetical protein N7536_001406 [Penicillium majusculum]|nr:hypothetical protein N7536_001406 [Penicillium majusculum]